MNFLNRASVLVRLALATCLLVTCGWLVPGAPDQGTVLIGVAAGVYGFVLIGKTGRDLRGGNTVTPCGHTTDRACNECARDWINRLTSK